MPRSFLTDAMWDKLAAMVAIACLVIWLRL
jgi:hypothetical protein